MWYRYWSAPAPDAVQTQPEDEFVRTLAEVSRRKNLNLDTSLFQDRFFMQLVSHQGPLDQSVVPGRSNPFAPFGSRVAPSSLSPAASAQPVRR